MALKITNLKKQYVGPDGSVVPVVDIELLSFGTGEKTALIGTSGSGKTTLLNLIAGIVPADNGEIEFAIESEKTSVTQNIIRLPEAQRDQFRGQHIGYVFQTHHLLPGFTAMENVLLGMSFTGRPADKVWAKRLLCEVGLENRLDYRPEKLSVGQQQRVAVARAMANRPSLVLADEPTGALDEKNAQQVLDLILKLCMAVKSTLILVTHDMNIAKQLPRTLVLSEINRAAVAV